MGGGIAKDAEVRVAITGTDEVAGAANRAFDPWERAGKRVDASLRSVGSAVGSAIAGIAQDVARVGTYPLHEGRLG